MKPDIKLFDYKQSSPECLPGFESFQDDQNEKFYFCLNDENGEPLVISRWYQSATTRDRGLKSLQKYMDDESRFSTHEEEGKYFFLFNSSKNKPIAKSISFEDEKDMQTVLQELISGDIVTETVDKESDTISAKPAKPSLKSRITIDFYRSDNGQALNGRIEHPLSGAKQIFKGFDRQAILSFIESHLPAADKKQEKQMQKELGKYQDALHPYLESNGDRGQAIQQGEPFSVYLPLPEVIQSYDEYHLVIASRKFGTSEIVELLSKKEKLKAQKELVQVLRTPSLEAGTYSLTTHLTLKSGRKRKELKGTVYFEVFTMPAVNRKPRRMAKRI